MRTNGSAIAALVFGLMSLLLPGMLSIPAVVFGVLGKRAIKRSAGRERGVGMAISGIVLGILTLLMLVVLVVLGTFTGVGVSDHATSAALPAVSTLVA